MRRVGLALVQGHPPGSGAHFDFQQRFDAPAVVGPTHHQCLLKGLVRVAQPVAILRVCRLPDARHPPRHRLFAAAAGEREAVAHIHADLSSQTRMNPDVNLLTRDRALVQSHALGNGHISGDIVLVDNVDICVDTGCIALGLHSQDAAVHLEKQLLDRQIQLLRESGGDAFAQFAGPFQGERNGQRRRVENTHGEGWLAGDAAIFGQLLAHDNCVYGLGEEAGTGHKTDGDNDADQSQQIQPQIVAQATQGEKDKTSGAVEAAQERRLRYPQTHQHR